MQYILHDKFAIVYNTSNNNNMIMVSLCSIMLQTVQRRPLSLRIFRCVTVHSLLH